MMDSIYHDPLAPIRFEELFRDTGGHMSLEIGRYLQHNALRQAMGQETGVDSTIKGVDPAVRDYLDRVIELHRPDGDRDGIPDPLDKCSADSRNASTAMSCDDDRDGYGNVCDPDFDQNFFVNASDFASFVRAFRGLDPAPWPQGMDMDCNGIVNATEFSRHFVPKFMGALGARPGPSGLACAGASGCS
jgi:hypothetical protein